MSRDRAVELGEELMGVLRNVDINTAQAALQIARILLIHKQDMYLVKSARDLTELPINVP